jgi:hypothetical protein
MTQDNSALDTDQLIIDVSELDNLRQVINMQNQMGAQLGLPIDEYGNPSTDLSPYTCCLAKMLRCFGFIRLFRC